MSIQRQLLIAQNSASDPFLLSQWQVCIGHDKKLWAGQGAKESEQEVREKTGQHNKEDHF